MLRVNWIQNLYSPTISRFFSRGNWPQDSTPSMMPTSMRCASACTRRSGASRAIRKQTLKPVFPLMGARVETTWVPGAFQLWVRGVNVRRPALDAGREDGHFHRVGLSLPPGCQIGYTDPTGLAVNT
jgi:hypothetical protein